MSAPACYWNPCTAAESARYATSLRRLLAALDREIVLTALVGEGEADLLDTERQEVDRVREFLHGGVAVGPEFFDLRCRALAVLDAFLHETKTTADHSHSPHVARVAARYVAAATSLPLRWLQRRAWARRAAALAMRPSGTRPHRGDA